jgi:hypothetical protein
MVAPYYLSKGTIASSASDGTSYSVSGASPQDNDLLFLIIAADSDATISTDDSSWTPLTNQINVGTTFGARVYYKTAASTDGVTTVNSGPPTGLLMRIGQQYCFTCGGGSAGTPVINAINSGSGTGTVVTIPSISVASNGTYLGVSIVAVGDNVVASPTNSWTERGEDVSSAGDDGGICVETKSLTTAGTEASHTRTYSTSNPWVAWSFYLSEPVNNSQSLTASLFNNGTDTFYGPTVTSNRPLTVARYDNSADTFYGPTIVRKLQELTAGLYNNGTDTFYAPTLRQQQLLTATRYDNSTDTFYNAKLGWGIKPNPYSDGDTFHAPSITTLKALTATLFNNGTDIFYSPTVVNLKQFLTAERFDNGTDTFHAPSAKATKDLTAARFDDSADTIYAPTARANKNLTPTPVAHTNSFYTHALVKEQFLTMSHVMDPADAFFVPEVKGFKDLTAARFDDSIDTFYPVIAYAKKDLVPPTIVSENSFNAHVIAHFYLLIADLFDDGDTFYDADISAPPPMEQFLTPETVVLANDFPSPLVQRVGDFVASERDTTHLARHLGLNLVHALRLELRAENGRVQYLGSLPADAIITGTIVHVIEGFGSGTYISAGYDVLYANVISPTASHTGRVTTGGPITYQFSKMKTLYARLHGDTIDPNGRASVIVHYVPGAE